MTKKKVPVVQQMADNAPAQEDAARGTEPNQRQQRALEAQNQIDNDRGYRRIEWKPGVYLWQHLATQHTTPDGEDGELEMRRVHNDYVGGQVR